MTTGEGTIAVPDSGTAPVRTLTITTLVDGVPTDVRMQVLALADPEGRVLRLVDIDFRAAIVAELRAIRQGLELLVEQPLL